MNGEKLPESNEELLASAIEDAVTMLAEMGVPIIPNMFASVVAEVICHHFDLIPKAEIQA